MNKLFNNPKTAIKIIVTFMLLFLIWLAYEVKADDFTTFEAGAATVSWDFDGGSNFFLAHRWDNRWTAGLGLLSQIDYKDRTAPNNPVIFGQRIVYGPGVFNHIGLGVGAAYLQNKGITNGSNFGYMLSIEYYGPHKGFWPDFVIYRHISNAGSSYPNPGIDLLNGGYAFGK